MISIIDYNAGNTLSVKNAFGRLGCETNITNDIDQLNNSDKLILPGVGDASYAMEKLNASGLISFIKQTKKPILGICLGMQLLCRYSEEGNSPCLGIFDIDVKQFPSTERVPHIGWNEVHDLSGRLMQSTNENDDVYFVHSYYVPLSVWTSSRANYILPFSASIERENFYATQFHPEKSGQIGEAILKNFLTL